MQNINFRAVCSSKKDRTNSTWTELSFQTVRGSVQFGQPWSSCICLNDLSNKNDDLRWLSRTTRSVLLWGWRRQSLWQRNCRSPCSSLHVRWNQDQWYECRDYACSSSSLKVTISYTNQLYSVGVPSWPVWRNWHGRSVVGGEIHSASNLRGVRSHLQSRPKASLGRLEWVQNYEIFPSEQDIFSAGCHANFSTLKMREPDGYK